MAEARQPPHAAAAQAAAVRPAAAHPAQESPRQTAQPSGAESGAPLPSVLVSAGEKKLDIRYIKTSVDVFYCTAACCPAEKKTPGTD